MNGGTWCLKTKILVPQQSVPVYEEAQADSKIVSVNPVRLLKKGMF